MATSVNPTDNVSNNDDFWEKASIELDIAIDEQDDGKCDEIVEIPALDAIFLKKIFRLDIEDKDRKEFWRLIIDKNGDLKGDLKNETIIKSRKSEEEFWAVFFLAKKLRAKLLSEKKDKQSKKLDWVVDLLLKKGASLTFEDKPFRYLLLMLELAACTIGEQSLGFSQKAKEILLSVKDEFPKEWKFHAYNALIHYNQGVAKAHMGQHHDALKEYDDTLKEYKEAKKGKLNTDIWLKYVRYPALLQKAEVLIKMQFSYNALKTLDEIKVDGKNQGPSSFHKARKELLKATCYIDLEDWEEFKEHFKKRINKPGKNGKKYFDESSLVNPESFLDATKPQESKSGVLPSLLASSYNSLVLGGAKEELKDKVDKILLNPEEKDRIKDLKSLGITEFLKSYMEQCKYNRFDRWTLEGTILDYIEILVQLVNEELKDFNATGPVLGTINSLMQILDVKRFIEEEIDPGKKPSIPPDYIKKARETLGNLNDEILNAWFKKKGKLPNPLKRSFEFEKDLINKLLGNPLDLPRKSCDKNSLEVRQRLLCAITKKKYQPENLEELEKNLVCICDNKNRKHCLNHVLRIIENDHEPDKEVILQFADYDEILRREKRHFKKHTTGRSVHPLPVPESQSTEIRENNYSVNYVGLRRWNSYTPELSFSVGGGHFVFLSRNAGKDRNKDKGEIYAGIAVDPGFDFIRNFFRQGFTLTDIDIVLLTHGHPDHIRDFPAIVELLYENRKRGSSQELDGKKIYAVMSLGCYQRLYQHIAKEPFKFLFYDTIIVDIDDNTRGADEHPNGGSVNSLEFSCEIKNRDKPVELITPSDTKDCTNPKESISLNIEYCKSIHEDHSESDSYGYIIIFSSQKGEEGKKASIGFTGDSRWFPSYPKKFQNCDIICSHIGSIAKKPLREYTIGEVEKLMRTKNHPYLFGEILFLQDWKEKLSKETLVLISEFGEEMKGQIRSDLTKRLNLPRQRQKSGCWSDFGPTNSKSPTDSTDSNSPIDGCENKNPCEEKYRANVFTIPVDVGLRISVPLENEGQTDEKKNKGLPGKVHCVVCDEFIRPDRIDYEVYSHEEAIFYVCETCRRSVSLDVRHATYQKYHEKGREIEKYESS